MKKTIIIGITATLMAISTTSMARHYADFGEDTVSDSLANTKFNQQKEETKETKEIKENKTEDRKEDKVNN